LAVNRRIDEEGFDLASVSAQKGDGLVLSVGRDEQVRILQLIVGDDVIDGLAVRAA